MGIWDEKFLRWGFGSVLFNVDLNEVFEVVFFIYLLGIVYEERIGMELNGFVFKFDNELKFDELLMVGDECNSKYDMDKVFVDIFEESWVIVDDVKLVMVLFMVWFFLCVFFRFGFDRRRSFRGFVN